MGLAAVNQIGSTRDRRGSHPITAAAVGHLIGQRWLVRALSLLYSLMKWRPFPVWPPIGRQNPGRIANPGLNKQLINKAILVMARLVTRRSCSGTSLHGSFDWAVEGGSYTGSYLPSVKTLDAVS